MIGAVLQPHFMPWLGYLSVVKACDIFVLYDDVQYSREGWYRRNRVLNSFKKEPVFINAPVISKSNSLIKDIKFIEHKGLEEVENQLNSSYDLKWRDDEGAQFVKELILCTDTSIRSNRNTLSLIDEQINLATLNKNILEHLCEYLNIKTKIVLSSTLDIPKADRYLRVPLICEKLGITKYYNGQASKEYMTSEEDFKEYNTRGIDYGYWNYIPKEYSHYTKCEIFHPRLSSLDAILSMTKEEVIELISKSNLQLECS